MAYNLTQEDLPPTSIPPGGVAHFRDFIPAEEEGENPGMGLGNQFRDFIPEGTTGPEMARAEERLAERHKAVEKDKERLEQYKRSEASRRGK